MTEKPGVLQSMGLQRFEHDFATEQQQQLSSQETFYTIFILKLCDTPRNIFFGKPRG